MGLLLILLIFTLHSSDAGIVTARGKPASSSSAFSTQGPEKAVDGDTESLYPIVFHTRPGTSHWWQVDLLEDVMSPKITIFFRVFGTYRRNGVRVSWSNTSTIPTVFCHNVSGAADGSNIPAVYNVTSCGGMGRYVTISTVTDNGNGAGLDFGEVEVHACSLTTYGAACNLTCPCGNGGTCDPDTQQCITNGGPCPSMKYGAACEHDCHCAGPTCDETSGVCPSGCAVGWMGSNCNTVISANDVNIALKYLPACNVNFGYEETTVPMATLEAMETVSRTTRIECMHVCDALDLCTAFTSTVPDCSLWKSGISDLIGDKLVWTKMGN